VDNNLLTAVYDQRNELNARGTGGSLALHVRGTLNEAGTVTVNSAPARMGTGNTFDADVTAGSGPNTLSLVARDVSGNQTTANYSVSLSGTGATYTYDANGNLAQKVDSGVTTTYTWDAQNRLTQVQNGGNAVATFAYDPSGRRVQKVAGSVTTTFTYDGAAILRQAGGTGTLKYIHGLGIDEPLASDDGTALTYLQADGLGSVIKTTSAAGAVTMARQYDAWGGMQTGGSAAGFAFTGREWDPETNLYYYRARYYDRELGRFISMDPIGLEGGINFYTYANGAPVVFKDPSGLKILVCNRPAELPIPGDPNHAYFWDTRPGQRNCGRGSKSGHETGPGTPGTVCYEVPGTDSAAVSNQILDCCQRTANNGMFIFGAVNPIGQPTGSTGLKNQSLNDCHTSVYRCLFAAGLPSPPHPRFGCRDCAERYQYPHEYGQ
jgi:RHS repeat-associated protein